MMGLDERIGWLLLGMAVGFVLGYIVRSLREIKEEVDDIDNLMRRRQNESKEGGFTNNPIVLNVILLFVVVLTAFAAFSTQSVNNKVQDTQAVQKQILRCNRIYLEETIVALNERTKFVQKQAVANVQLQKAEHDFFNIILNNQGNEAVSLASFKDYISALDRFLNLNWRVMKDRRFQPYPTAQELSRCLNR